jgi:hypothetical protein
MVDGFPVAELSIADEVATIKRVRDLVKRSRRGEGEIGAIFRGFARVGARSVRGAGRYDAGWRRRLREEASGA